MLRCLEHKVKVYITAEDAPMFIISAVLYLESLFFTWTLFVHLFLLKFYTFYMSSVTFVLQQDGVPAHTSNRVQHFIQEQNYSFWSKNTWPPFSPDANPLDYAFWPHIEARACNVCHPNITALRTSVDRQWRTMEGHEQQLRYQKL